MSEKKNIDRLFQEKFKDFEAEPPEVSWEVIAEGLDNKRKRRVLPIWWKRGGVAAALLLGLFLADQGGMFQGRIQNDTVVGTEGSSGTSKSIKPGSIETENSLNQAPTSTRPAAGTGVVSSNSSEDSENPSSTNSVHPTIKNTDKNQKGSVVASGPADDIHTGKVSDGLKKTRSSQRAASKVPALTARDQVAFQENTAGANSRKQKGLKVSSKADRQQSDDIREIAQKTASEKKSYGSNTTVSRSNQQESQIAEIQPSEIQKQLHNQNDPVTDNQNTLTQTPAGTNPEKETTIDSTAIANVEPNAMGELLYEKENPSVTKNEQKINRWQVDTHVAPIYLSSFSGGSSIDPQFNNNDKSSRTTLSYGVGARYVLGKRWSVRAGVNSIAMEQRTNDVAFSQGSMARRQLQHVDANMQGSFLNIQSGQSPQSGIILSNNLEGFNINASQTKEMSGSLSQKTGYIEVPVEVTYSILNKRFGVEVVGGMSTLFLQQNEISLVSGDTEMEIGRANNLNNTHFTTNLGLGMYYRIFRNMNVRVEPMLKYQLNAYSGTGDYKPYFFGLYTGLNYRF